MAPGQFTQTIGSLMGGGDDRTTRIDRQAIQRIRYADLRKVSRLVKKGIRLDQHETRENGPHPRNEGPAAELRKRVMAAIGRDDIVRCLWPAIKPNNRIRRMVARQEIGNGAFAAVTKGEVDQQERVRH